MSRKKKLKKSPKPSAQRVGATATDPSHLPPAVADIPRSPRKQAPFGRRNDFEASGASRLIGDWYPNDGNINRGISLNAPLMRARVRDMVRNFPPFARAVNGIVAFTVGNGARFQSLAVTPDGQPDHRARREIEYKFRLWMDHADVSGKLHLYELAQLAKRQECECGEYIARFTMPRDRRRSGELALQLHEPEELASWRVGERAEDTEVWDGIEYDIYSGEPLGYHFQRSEALMASLFETWREPAANVLHGFQTLRPGQLRGVSPFAPVVMLARDMENFTLTVLDQAAMAAKWLAFVKSSDPYGTQQMRTPFGTNNRGEKRIIDDLENCVIEYLNQDEDINIATPPNSPNDAFSRFVNFVLRMVAVTIDLPYPIISGDYTGVNYSTSKAERNDFAMMLKPHQFRSEHHFFAPIFRRWLEHAALQPGNDFLSDYWRNPERFQPAMWIPAGLPSNDPLREGKANIDLAAAGFTSPQRVILERGDDPEAILDELAEWNRMCTERGLDPFSALTNIDTSLANNPAKLGANEEYEH